MYFLAFQKASTSQIDSYVPTFNGIYNHQLLDKRRKHNKKYVRKITDNNMFLT